MKTARICPIMIALILCASLTLAQQPQQPPGPTPEERRIMEIMAEEARRREAEDRAREQQRLDQLEADMEGMSRREPPTEEELEARRRKRFPEFQKNVARFHATSTEIAVYSSATDFDSRTVNEIRKKARSLEGHVDRLIDYMLDGEEAPDLPEADYAAQPLKERLSLLTSMAPSVHQRLKTSFARSKAVLIDADAAEALFRDLQSVKLLSRSLRR